MVSSNIDKLVKNKIQLGKNTFIESRPNATKFTGSSTTSAVVSNISMAKTTSIITDFDLNTTTSYGSITDRVTTSIIDLLVDTDPNKIVSNEIAGSSISVVIPQDDSRLFYRPIKVSIGLKTTGLYSDFIASNILVSNEYDNESAAAGLASITEIIEAAIPPIITNIQDYYGDTANDLSWTYDENTRVLTINGGANFTINKVTIEAYTVKSLIYDPTTNTIKAEDGTIIGLPPLPETGTKVLGSVDKNLTWLDHVNADAMPVKKTRVSGMIGDPISLSLANGKLTVTTPFKFILCVKGLAGDTYQDFNVVTVNAQTLDCPQNYTFNQAVYISASAEGTLILSNTKPSYTSLTSILLGSIFVENVSGTWQFQENSLDITPYLSGTSLMDRTYGFMAYKGGNVSVNADLTLAVTEANLYMEGCNYATDVKFPSKETFAANNAVQYRDLWPGYDSTTPLNTTIHTNHYYSQTTHTYETFSPDATGYIVLVPARVTTGQMVMISPQSVVGDGSDILFKDETAALAAIYNLPYDIAELSTRLVFSGESIIVPVNATTNTDIKIVNTTPKALYENPGSGGGSGAAAITGIEFEQNGISIADNIKKIILEASMTGTDVGDNTLKLGGNKIAKQLIEYTFNTPGKTIPLGTTIDNINQIDYVNIGNVQLLRKNYTLSEDKQSIVLNTDDNFPTGTEANISLYIGAYLVTWVGITDAPIDGNSYIRKDGTWVKYNEITGFSIIDTPVPAVSNYLNLVENKQLYNIKATATTDLNIYANLDNMPSDSQVITFQVQVDATEFIPSSINWGLGVNPIYWESGDPVIEELGMYTFAFRTKDGGFTWTGNLAIIEPVQNTYNVTFNFTGAANTWLNTTSFILNNAKLNNRTKTLQIGSNGSVSLVFKAIANSTITWSIASDINNFSSNSGSITVSSDQTVSLAVTPK